LTVVTFWRKRAGQLFSLGLNEKKESIMVKIWTVTALIMLGGCTHPFEQSVNFNPVIESPVVNVYVDNGNDLQMVQQQSWTKTARETRRDAELEERTERLREGIAADRSDCPAPTDSAYDREILEALKSSSDEDRVIRIRVGKPATQENR